MLAIGTASGPALIFHAHVLATQSSLVPVEFGNARALYCNTS